MSYCKIAKYENDSKFYYKESDMRALITYIINLNKTRWEMNGFRNLVLFNDIYAYGEFITKQFLLVQGSMYGCNRRVYHIIVSLDSVLDIVSGKDLFKMLHTIGERVLDLYPEYQSIYAVHEDTKNYHIHFVFNNLSPFTNVRLTSKMNIFKIQRIVDEIIFDEQGILY